MTEQQQTTATIHPELVSEALEHVAVESKLAASELVAAAELVASTTDALVVESDAGNVAAGESLRALKGVILRLDAHRSAMKAPFLEGGRAVDDFFRAPLGRLTKAEAGLKSKIGSWAAEQQRIAREQEAARVAELRRRQAEEEERAAADAATSVGFDPAGAMDETVVMPVPILPPPMPTRVSGVSTRMVPKARITDVRAILRAALDGNDIAFGLIVVDERKLNALAKTLGTSLTIPGVQIYEEPSVSARGV